MDVDYWMKTDMIRESKKRGTLNRKLNPVCRDDKLTHYPLRMAAAMNNELDCISQKNTIASQYATNQVYELTSAFQYRKALILNIQQMTHRNEL